MMKKLFKITSVILILTALVGFIYWTLSAKHSMQGQSHVRAVRRPEVISLLKPFQAEIIHFRIAILSNNRTTYKVEMEMKIPADVSNPPEWIQRTTVQNPFVPPTAQPVIQLNQYPNSPALQYNLFRSGTRLRLEYVISPPRRKSLQTICNEEFEAFEP